MIDTTQPLERGVERVGRIRRRFVRGAAAPALVAALLGLALGNAATALAHGLEPASLALREIGPGVFQATWRASALRVPGTNVQPVLPERCRHVGEAEGSEPDDADRIALRWSVDCGSADLTGERIEITDLGAAKINALLTIERLSGPPVQAILSPGRATFTFAAPPTRLDVVREYTGLGFDHIVGGPDHLLFVLGLLLLVSTSRLLLTTVTAFTIGHSITLSAAVLGLARIPQRPIEVLIALSILVLAVELTRDGKHAGRMQRAPWMMALAFGLLHGFGFAGALAEAGLPADQIPLALVSFNAGIEIAQLAFVGGALLLYAGLRHRLPALAARARMPIVYATGVLAAFWCFERIALWLA